jgi:spermidine/putrescine transport system ATP-binding protein
MMVETHESQSRAAASPAGEVPLLRLRGVSKRYGPVQAVAPLDLDIYPRDFVAMLGPSGCGKTTLLRMIGGFIPPSSGSIEIAGGDVTALGPEHRPTNMVFQGYGLFPHMNVAQNVGYGLRLQKRPRDEIADRVAEALRLVQLTALAERSTEQLSGGQQQRVALARALVMRPKVLLLDEPLAALDLKLRHAMQDELRRIHHEIGGTFVFVTHDQGEALALANRIAVMHDGRLEQVGTAEDIYGSPQTRFVATFIGEANVFDGTRESGIVTLKAGPRFAAAGANAAVAAIVRPEDLLILEEGETSDHTIEAVIEDAIFLGSHLRYRLRGPAGESLLIHTRPAKGRPHAIAERVRAGWRDGDHRVVSA